MALTYSEPVKLGERAPDFELPCTDGKSYCLSRDFKDSKALVIAFICNHCPYVHATQGGLNELARTYSAKGVRVLGINSNDSVKYPEDSFSAMKAKVQEWGFVFPYLHDETQEVAKAYGAVCTPDFYAFTPSQGGFALQYRGRLDDLAVALDLLLAGKALPPHSKPSMGCSIKWK